MWDCWTRSAEADICIWVLYLNNMKNRCALPVHGQWCKDQHFRSHWCCSAWLWDKHPDHWHTLLTPLKQARQWYISPQIYLSKQAAKTICAPSWKKKENNTSSQTHKHKTSVILSHFILWGTKNNFSFCQMLPLTPLKARKVRSKQNYLCTCCVWCSGQWWGCNWL